MVDRGVKPFQTGVKGFFACFLKLLISKILFFPWFWEVLEGLERSGRLMRRIPPMFVEIGLDGTEL